MHPRIPVRAPRVRAPPARPLASEVQDWR
eukprot:COSAG02_NODE_64225_length_261_cov_0.629630_1_plen_28_part_10